MSKQKILTMLKTAGESYLSGEVMSRELGISRAAVSKAIAGLRQEGYTIDSVTNRGYRLVFAPDKLTEGEIRPYLHSQVVGNDLICLETVDSTNNYLKVLANDGAADGTVAVANEQTGGRGRLGRSFQSPKDKGIYLSAILRPPVMPVQAVNMTAFVAVAVCDAIEAACGVRPGIKWTNDIVLGNQKLCGILTEMGIEGEGVRLQYVIPGIGINVNHTEEDFAPDVREVATSLALSLGHPVSRGRLAAELINALDRMYACWRTDKTEYWEKYRRDCLTLGKEVRLLRGGGEEQAFAEDVDEDFGLVVRHPDGRRETVVSGEVSVRGLFGYV